MHAAGRGGETEAAGGVGPAEVVVPDGDMQRAVSRLHGNVHDRDTPAT